MGNFDWKDKKNIFVIVMILAIGGLGFAFYEMYWLEFEAKKAKLEIELKEAEDDLAKINIQNIGKLWVI